MGNLHYGSIMAIATSLFLTKILFSESRRATRVRGERWVIKKAGERMAANLVSPSHHAFQLHDFLSLVRST